MIKKAIKTFSLIIIAISCYTILIMPVFAVEITAGFTPTSPTAPGGECTQGTNGEKQYCNIKYIGYEEILKLSESIYDTEGNYISEALLLRNRPDILYISGRFIGIDAYEEYKRKYQVTINPSCAHIKVKCKKTEKHNYCTYKPECNCSTSWYRSLIYYEGCHSYPSKKKKGWLCPTYKEKCTYYDESDTTCPNGYEFDECEYLSCTPPTVASCRGEAEQELDRMIENTDVNPSYEAKRQDVNDIYKGVSKGDPPEPIITEDLEPIGYSDKSKLLPEDVNSTLVYKEVIMHYSYNLPKACISVKSAYVDYVPMGTNCPPDYLEVPEITAEVNNNMVHIGQYFMPLNAKTGDKLRYYLYPKVGVKTPLSVGLCHNLVNKYATNGVDKIYWKDVAVDIYGKPFPTNMTNEEAKTKIQGEGGCYLSYLSAFLAKQEFYDEEKNEFKGYNFYYRPIDYNRPFPNGLYETSFWYELYNTSTQKITVNVAGKSQPETYNLKDSFGNVTYETNDSYNAKTIRDYNKLTGSKADNDKIYASWSGLRTNGTSSFIDGGNGVIRKSCNSVYALGCGPANADWDVCKRKTEVCG